jgi:Zn-dependent peptidase ImmA (M78 family)/transcriptional regulator with XRE-family HTH domain
VARSPEALVENQILVWARESAGLSHEDVAERLKVAIDKILSWEAGESRPSISQLRRLSQIYKRPMAVFFLTDPPRDFMPVRDFRRKADQATPEEVSVALRAEIRRATELRDAAVALFEDREEDIRPFPIVASLASDPDDVAGNLRKALGVSLSAQAKWPDAYAALREWRVAAESLGVLVIQTSKVELDEMRGFSLTDAPISLVCLNANDTPNGRIFTLMHELSHIAIREGGLCEWEHPRQQSTANESAEAFCNRLAGAVLVPEDELRNAPVVAGATHPQAWSNEELRLLARQFGVSREVVLRRLVIIGLATQQFYQRKRDEFLEEYRALPKSKGFRVAYEKRVANSLGHAFLELVLSSYYEKRITLAGASTMMGVRIKHIPSIEYEVLGWSHFRAAGT